MVPLPTLETAVGGGEVPALVTFSWIDQNRRMSKDYERLCASGDALVYAAMIRLMMRRLVRTLCGCLCAAWSCELRTGEVPRIPFLAVWWISLWSMRRTPPNGIVGVADPPEQNVRWLGRREDFCVGRRENGIG